MHPESQSLEASFEPTAGRPESASSTAPQDPIVEDFNAFFEKLSSLDNLQWSAAPASNAVAAPAAPTASAAPAAPSSTAARPRRKAPAQAQGATGGKPRMTVLKSDTDLATPPADAAEPAGPPTSARGRITVRDVARFLKLTLVGLVLFALGLGAGWAALSLPGRFDDPRANFSDLMERTRAMALPRVEAGKAASAPADRLRVVEAAQGATAAAGPASAPATPPRTTQSAARSAGQTAPAQAPGSAETADTAEPETGFVMPGPERAARSQPAASRTGTVAATTPATGITAAGSTAAHGTASTEARFTLQVGACSSFACVENYRHLLLEKVSPRAIKVVSQPQAGGGATIQRIRVQPLERGEAERLKAELAAQDARFNDAYVMALR